ncbi:hypothetical protein PoB_005590400 [Plakobranchus ocellatus]|uniref:Uncharacterized protein n=1 Tax=Plakobranchus ocellatus TaxID=259542 RepID=A0AAV4CF70_9GAST|nr:hypothetical protein PoB_005590400 [Plakobranchus ocellatus]
MDLDKRDCNDTSFGLLQWESADNSFEDEGDNSRIKGVTSSCGLIVDYQEATRPNSETTTADGQLPVDMTVAEQSLHDLSSNIAFSFLDVASSVQVSVEDMDGMSRRK